MDTKWLTKDLVANKNVDISGHDFGVSCALAGTDAAI